MIIKNKIEEILNRYLDSDQAQSAVRDVLRIVDDYYDGFHPTHVRGDNSYQLVFKALLSTNKSVAPGTLLYIYRNNSGVTWAKPEIEYRKDFVKIKVDETKK